jgi:hypothetical protein
MNMQEETVIPWCQSVCVNYSSWSTNNSNILVVGYVVDKRHSVSNLFACWWLDTADFTYLSQQQGDFEDYGVELGLEYDDVYKSPKSFRLSHFQLK